MRLEGGHSMMARQSSAWSSSADKAPRASRLIEKDRVKERTSVTTCSAIEHPGRDLQPSPGLRSVQSATENAAISLVDRRMNEDVALEPRMKPIQKLPTNGPMGVREPRCTTPRGRTDHWATNRRRPRSSSPPSPRGPLRNPDQRRCPLAEKPTMN